MTYRKLFDPDVPTGQQPFDPDRSYRLGDQTPEAENRYVYDDNIVLAVNVALAAGRPLLVRGQPGTGKSSLARSVADLLDWRYYAVTVSSRTAARDLLWSFDTVARLADAQAGTEQLLDRSAYVNPGVLWWAFDPDSAKCRGLSPEKAAEAHAEGRFQYANYPNRSTSERAVVLIDEIDKADPDVPNDLLVPLGSFQFRIEDGQVITAQAPPLVIITTNEERDLPRAFLRRCVILALAQPDPNRLRRIVRTHFENVDDELLDQILGEYDKARASRKAAGSPLPSVAELIDAVAAAVHLQHPGPGDPDWPSLATLLLDKVTAIPEDV